MSEEKIAFNIADIVDSNDPQGRTYREINNATEHKFSVGQLVAMENGVRLFIAKQTRDCDGTPLYCLTPKENDFTQYREGFANSNWLNGYCCESLKAVKI